MSEENVEIVRQVFDAVARRDTATILALYDPKVEVNFSPGTLADRIVGAEAGTFRGHEGLRAFDRELRQAFQEFETNCEELISAGERVVSVSRYRGRGRSSGLKVDGPPQFGIWTIWGGRITRVDWFDERGEALRAAGLSE
jgi:ketosteroid isomerase-like protein